MEDFMVGPVSRPQEPPVGTPSEGAKRPNLLGRVVRGIRDYNTYIPGISTVTGLGKVVLGVLTAGWAITQMAIGAGAGALSIVAPKEQWSTTLLKFSSARMGVGAYQMGIGLREAFRGAISSVPVVGNLVVLGADALSGKVKGIADPFFAELKPMLDDWASRE